MSYISMAAPIGPWIETTLVLAGMLLFNLLAPRMTQARYVSSLGLSTACGAIGGILATAFGFSLPTLYFISPELFNSWMEQPLYFALYLTGLACAAGSFGFLLAHIFEKQLIVKERMEFPIGSLIYKMISAQDQLGKAISMAIGFLLTKILLYLQRCTNFIAHQVTIFNKFAIGFITIPKLEIEIDLLPMFWAVGFVTGHVIAIPLLVGVASKIFCIEPLHKAYPFILRFIENGLSYVSFKLPMGISTNININDFTLAFCSGMVLFGALSSFMSLPKLIKSIGKKISGLQAKTESNNKEQKEFIKEFPWIQAGIALIFNLIFLAYFGFSILSALYLLIFTGVCTYQLMIIAGKIGIAPLGRFATFVMVPGMFLFGFNPVQTTFVAAFVEIAGGVACDVLFGRKMAMLALIERKKIIFFQWLGLIISALSIGIIFWILIHNFGLGNQAGALAVSKAASRALLINIQNFDIIVLLFGLIFGYLLSLSSINSMLVLGGILMPIQLSVMLILGGLSTYLTKNKEEHYPFWSGVFAANSLWMLIKTFFAKSC